MPLPKTILSYLLFFSFPLIATLKGKGTVLSLILAFFLFNGLQSLKLFFTEIECKITTSVLLIVGFVFIFLPFSNGKDFFHALRLILLFILIFFTLKGIKTLSLEERRKSTKLFFQGFVFYFFFFLVELYGGSWASKLYSKSPGYNENLFIRGTVILTFLFLPFSFFIQKNKIKNKALLLGVSFLALCLILAKAQPSAARVAIIVSGICFVATYYRTIYGFLILALAGIYSFLTPVISLYLLNETTLLSSLRYLPTSYQHRLQIWHEISKNVLQKPFFGHGFDYASKLTEGPQRWAYYTSEKFNMACSENNVLEAIPHTWGGIICHTDTVLSCHPHSGALQIWLEFGFLGIIFFLYCLYKLGQYSKNQGSLYRGYLYALFGLYFVYWSISFGMWQNWIISLAGLTFILFQLINGLPSEKER
ncbi:O-antigen ligase family protein [Alphaproteobacteria bacterium]|nr:O-antigen ligase family protein [Alphaproteobacteria bacterium]